MTFISPSYVTLHTAKLSSYRHSILKGCYKVVQIWPGQTVTCLHTNSPGHIWTTLYFPEHFVFKHFQGMQDSRPHSDADTDSNMILIWHRIDSYTDSLIAFRRISFLPQYPGQSLGMYCKWMQQVSPKRTRKSFWLSSWSKFFRPVRSYTSVHSCTLQNGLQSRNFLTMGKDTTLQNTTLHFNAMNSVHFCSITFRSN
jgi:hypothetical protein